MTDRELMQQALDALDALENSVDTVQHEYDADWRHGLPTRKAQLDGMKECLDAHIAAITSLRERLAQPEQEPVAWISAVTGDVTTQDMSHTVSWVPLTTPPAAQPAMFGPMGTVGDLFDKHVIANGNLKKEWIVYLEKNT